MTTSDYLTQLQQDREDLVDNLETKGITGLTGDETFTELVPEVLNIPSGTAGVYKVSSFDDMNNLTDMSAGDYCIIDLGKLPNTYEKLEYIKGYSPNDSNGTYIDTNFYANQNTTKIIIVTQLLKQESRFISGIVDNGIYYGLRPHDIYSSNNTMRWHNGSTNVSGGSWENVTVDYLFKHLYTFDGKKLYVDGNLKSNLINDENTTFNYKLPLLARNNNGTMDGWCNCNLYYALIYDGNNLIRQFIPAKRKSDNVVGLYDLVNDTFYTNAGSYNFDYGASTNDEISYLFYYDGTNWVIA